MKRLSTFLAVLLCAVTATFADAPFRNHRYDAFKVLPVNSEQIVFVGNSITNMHEWWEAFGNHNVIGRGVSGAVTDEALANIEAIASGNPKKIFFMLGTNDLGTAGISTTEHVLTNMTLIVERVQAVSPETKIYIQSLLPSGHLGSGGTRTPEALQAANEALKALCTEKGITYIDLWDELQDVASNANGMSYDKLHLTAAAYKIWCDKVAPHVMDDTNAKSLYTDATQQHGDMSTAAYKMRATVFSKLPVASTDILIIGDEMIHAGEWHEFLQSGRIKNRGTAWGYPGPGLADMLKQIPVILHDDATPAQVFLYAGVSDVNGSTDINTVMENYKAVVAKIKELSPDTKVTLMSLQPTQTAATNTGRVVPFNALLKAYADESAEDNIEYLDIYTDFVNGDVANTAYFNGNYLYGKGYAKVALKIAEQINTIDPEANITALTEEQTNAAYTRFTNRTALGTAIVKVAGLPEGDGVGQYTTANLAGVKEKIAAAYEALKNSEEATDEFTEEVESLTEAANTLLPKINQPTYSTEQNEVWYQLYTPNRGSRYLTSNGAGAGVTGNDKHNYATGMWKFVLRGDGTTLDIINRNDGSYLAPTAAYNAQITTSETQPDNGWTLSYANTAGLFIVSSGTVQLNQTQSGLNYKVYNWSEGQTGTDRSDAGCQYMVSLVTSEPDELPKVEEDATLYYFAANTKQPDGSYVNRYLYVNANGALANATEYDADDENYLWSVIVDNTSTYFLNKGTSKYLSYANKSLTIADTRYAFQLKDDAVHKDVGAKSLYNANVLRYMVMEDDGNSFNQYQQPVNNGEWCSDYILEAQKSSEEVIETMTLTFTRGNQTATVTAPEGITATIEATAPKSNASTNDGLWNTGGTLANSLDVLCTKTNTSQATEAEPIVYKLTINGLPANQPFGNVVYTSKAFNAGGNYQNYTEIRHCNFKLFGNNDIEIGSLVDESIMIANGGEKTITFNNSDENNLAADENGTLVLTLKVWKGTNNNGCFYGLTAITLEKILQSEPGGSEEEEIPAEITYTIDKTNGSLYKNGSTPNESWNNTWKSTVEPQLVFSCVANNMNWHNNNLQLMAGGSNCRYTLTAPAGYVIYEYSFTFTNNNHDNAQEILMDNGAAYTTSSTPQTVSATKQRLTSLAFDLKGPNSKGVVLTDFVVKVKLDVAEPPQISTEGNEHWYYITSASTQTYCAGKVMYYDNGTGKLRFGDKTFSNNYVWSFWEKDGKLAIKNYKGEYFGTAGSGTGGSTAFGVVSEPNYIYNINEAYDFFVIKDDAVELHAQNDNKVIVRWAASEGGASLWRFDEVDVSNAATSLASTVVQQGKVTTGIGNVDQGIIRSTLRVTGLEGEADFQGVKGAFSGTDKADVANVKAYFATNDRELFIDADKKMTWREENGVQYGETVKLAEDGTFTITGTKNLAPGTYYLWITYDIAETAKEGNLVDASITSYTIDGKEVAESKGNPNHSVTIFLSEGAVLMPMDKGSLYYRIPSITVTTDGKRLVTLTDDRKAHNGDLPNHCYLVAQYSEDNGRTWSNPVTVAGTAETGGDYGHGDASIVTNRDNGEIVGIMTSAGTYGHGFFAGTSEQPPRWKTITSRDGGLTWETPVDHTDDLYGANCDNPDTKTWQSGFSGSGAALQKRDGTLVSSFVNRAADNSQNFHFFMSKDGGKNWYVSGTSGTTAADEPKTLERNNGDLAISVRASGYNYYNYTSDDGATWYNQPQTRFTTGISGNACDGEYMVWCSTLEGNPWNIALQTIPNSGSRENVSIALSTDEGATFGESKTICPRGSAYSATVVLPDGTLGVYYEENGVFGGYTMRFVRFSLDWASNGTYKFTEEAPFKPIASTAATEGKVESTIGKHKVGTFYANAATTIPTGIKAYVATEEPAMEDGNGTITMTEITDGIIPAKTGVVLRGEAGDYSFFYTAEDGTTDTEGNMLVGYAGAAEYREVSLADDYTTYVLTVQNDAAGFYRKEAGFSVYNHKAYLNVPSAQNVRSLAIRFDGDDTTGIENSEFTIQNSELIYDLQGRRVENPTKGVYIVNGKKVIK